MKTPQVTHLIMNKPSAWTMCNRPRKPGMILVVVDRDGGHEAIKNVCGRCLEQVKRDLVAFAKYRSDRP